MVGQGGGETGIVKICQYTVLITSKNVGIMCHKHALRLTISARMKRGKRELEKEGGE